MQRVKVSSLQTDMENSEAVQRDFVKLSQSLQVIRTVTEYEDCWAMACTWW